MIIDIKDDIYPVLSEKQITRNTVRALLINDKSEMCLIYVNGTDMFGKRDHFETPGGGVEGDESDIDALKREMLEETGYTIKNIKFLGEALIEYHLLKRYDHANFYICYTDKKYETHLEDYEKQLFGNNLWVKVSDVLKLYENKKVSNVGIMIHKRDYAMIKYAIDNNMLEV